MTSNLKNVFSERGLKHIQWCGVLDPGGRHTKDTQYGPNTYFLCGIFGHWLDLRGPCNAIYLLKKYKKMNASFIMCDFQKLETFR